MYKLAAQLLPATADPAPPLKTQQKAAPVAVLGIPQTWAGFPAQSSSSTWPIMEQLQAGALDMATFIAHNLLHAGAMSTKTTFSSLGAMLAVTSSVIILTNALQRLRQCGVWSWDLQRPSEYAQLRYFLPGCWRRRRCCGRLSSWLAWRSCPG